MTLIINASRLSGVSELVMMLNKPPHESVRKFNEKAGVCGFLSLNNMRCLSEPLLARQRRDAVRAGASGRSCGKMLLEAVQQLCTAFPTPDLLVRGNAYGESWAHCKPIERVKQDTLPYDRTKAQYNHPCALWVRASRANFDRAIELAEALAAEFRYRFDKSHGSEAALDWGLGRHFSWRAFIESENQSAFPEAPVESCSICLDESEE